MKALSLFGALVCVVFAHVLGVRLIPGFAIVVDLFLILAVLQALEGNEISAQLGGAVIGLVHDVFSGGAFGLFGVATTIISYLVALGARRLEIRDPIPLALVFMISSALYQAMTLGLASFFLGRVPTFGDTLLQVLASGILGLVSFLLRKRSRRRYHLWRRRRKRRLI